VVRVNEVVPAKPGLHWDCNQGSARKWDLRHILQATILSRMILKRIFPAQLYPWFVSLVVLALFAGTIRAQTNRTYSISALDISQVEQGWGEPHANQSVEGHALSIGGQTFTNGLGTHAASQFLLEVGGRAVSFSAMVGIDDEVGSGKGSAIFKVLGDTNRVLWESQELHGGDTPVVDRKSVV
jgi:hypothetical protein